MYDTCGEGNSVCWKSILTHSLIHPKVLEGLPTHSDPFCLSPISQTDVHLTLTLPLCPSELTAFQKHTGTQCPDRKQRQSPATVTFTWNLIYMPPEMKSLNGGQARERLLTCPSALVPPLGTDGVLFLKGTPTFHPFVSGCKEGKKSGCPRGKEEKR